MELRDSLEYIDGLERQIDDLYDSFKEELKAISERIDQLNIEVFSSVINDILIKVKFNQQQRYKVEQEVQTDSFYQSI